MCLIRFSEVRQVGLGGGWKGSGGEIRERKRLERPKRGTVHRKKGNPHGGEDSRKHKRKGRKTR